MLAIKNETRAEIEKMNKSADSGFSLTSLSSTPNGERFLAFARNDKQNNGAVISNPFGILRVNSVRDLSLTEPPPKCR
jgi:hypothetical protein